MSYTDSPSESCVYSQPAVFNSLCSRCFSAMLLFFFLQLWRSSLTTLYLSLSLLSLFTLLVTFYTPPLLFASFFWMKMIIK
jgi:hypothetical protein